MKGLELPINMIVVVLIAVLVLVTVGAFLAGQIGGGQNSIELEAAFSAGCNRLRTIENCANLDFPATGYKEPGQAIDATFLRVCQLKGLTEPGVCERACGCQIATP